MKEIARGADAMSGGLIARPALVFHMALPVLTYRVECFGADGRLKWEEEFHNLLTTAGKTDIVDKYFKGSSYTAAWYLGLKGSGSAATGDTLASHAGWTEITAYSGNRPAVTWGTTSGGSNTPGSATSFSMTGSYTVAGAFLCTVASGTSGTLYSAGDFGTARTGGNGDTLNVTPTVSIS